MKRIKLFLGGYVNAINAQNLNCRSLALHVDKEKFDIGVMTYPGGSLPMGDEFRGIKRFNLLFPLYRPLRFLRHINYLRALLWCDVAYLPKGEIIHFVKTLAKLLGKKTIMTVEGVIEGDNYKKCIDRGWTDDDIRNSYNGYDSTYSITEFMAVRNRELLGIQSDGVLYLGVECEQFKSKRHYREAGLRNIVFVGSNIRHKRVFEFLDVARTFPDIAFHIAGDDVGFAEELVALNIPNVTFHGRLNHDDLAKLLSRMDLHIFPSRSEGFPKVTLETAAAGVPSIVYGTYGAAEWITHGVNGYVVSKPQEIIEIVNELLQSPAKVDQLSQNAVELAQQFDWKNLVRTWEAAFEDVMRQH